MVSNSYGTKTRFILITRLFIIKSKKKILAYKHDFCKNLNSILFKYYRFIIIIIFHTNKVVNLYT